MDCCRRGCPLNKSTNKNANVNIFSHNFFHLEWGMKISHYIDRQQREQLTIFTVNEKDDFATPHFITCIWNDTGVSRCQHFAENKGKPVSHQHTSHPHTLLQDLQILGILGWTKVFYSCLPQYSLQRLVATKNNRFFFCIEFPVTEKQSIKKCLFYTLK